jgi:hypothetical protein
MIFEEANKEANPNKKECRQILRWKRLSLQVSLAIRGGYFPYKSQTVDT